MACRTRTCNIILFFIFQYNLLLQGPPRSSLSQKNPIQCVVALYRVLEKGLKSRGTRQTLPASFLGHAFLDIWYLHWSLQYLISGVDFQEIFCDFPTRCKSPFPTGCTQRGPWLNCNSQWGCIWHFRKWMGGFRLSPSMDSPRVTGQLECIQMLGKGDAVRGTKNGRPRLHMKTSGPLSKALCAIIFIGGWSVFKAVRAVVESTLMPIVDCEKGLQQI